MRARPTWAALLFASAVTLVLTWANEADSLHSWADLASFAFMTKAVVTFVGLTGCNALLAHRSWRDPMERTRAADATPRHEGPWRPLASYSDGEVYRMAPEKRARLEDVKAKNADKALGLRRVLGDVSHRE